jgi:2-keto-4-pentenoate hydratase/2-oxohepta-3-ene-1,7-dioic acid hydratase in catechol pathway
MAGPLSLREQPAMKIARFDDDRIGLIRGDKIIDVTDVADARSGEWPPVAMNRLIANFSQYRAKFERAPVANAKPLSQAKLLTPIPWPNKVIAYPVNYHDHGVEMGSSYRANNQGFFLKPPSALSGPSDPIVLPVNAGRRIDHECELAVIISKEGRDIVRERWREHAFGYACLIDAVIRGKEERVTRKGFDTFCPVGPWIVTEDEIGDAVSNLQGRLWVNGDLKQDANTRDLILDIPGMIEMASSVMTLYPGDIIATGTPAGVGPMRPGDRVRIEFERVGAMELDVVQGTSGANSIFAQPPMPDSKG